MYAKQATLYLTFEIIKLRSCGRKEAKNINVPFYSEGAGDYYFLLWAKHIMAISWDFSR
jgi:hypothetical protein